MPLLFTYFRAPTRWTDIVKRTVHEVGDDNCLGLAAQLAFYFLLALFPAVLFLVALVGHLPVDDALSELVVAVGAVAPREFVVILRGQLDQIAGDSDGGSSLLTLGIIGALWSSSAAMVGMIDALNRAYDITEWRSWWKRRFVAIALTMALALFVLVAVMFVLIGPTMASRAAVWFGLTPGALVATVLWIASSFAFKFYITNFADSTATYGAILGAIVTMLWFYVSGLAILIGAELNGVIEDSCGEAAGPTAIA
jgi:membrane protein